MGAIINMTPNLFNGIIAQVPFVDVITTMLDDTIPLTTGEYDEWGNIKQHWRRGAAGTMQAIGNDVADTKQVPFLYAGYFWLKRANLGLTHYRAYHPVLGRWLSKDPIGEIGGGNLYATPARQEPLL